MRESYENEGVVMLRSVKPSYFGVNLLANWMVRRCSPFATGVIEKVFVEEE